MSMYEYYDSFLLFWIARWLFTIIYDFFWGNTATQNMMFYDSVRNSYLMVMYMSLEVEDTQQSWDVHGIESMLIVGHAATSPRFTA